MSNQLVINDRDNVAVVLDDTAPGRGQKIARIDIAKGHRVIKYGYPIGITTRDIAAGEHVHTHNMRTRLIDKFEILNQKFNNRESSNHEDGQNFKFQNSNFQHSFLGYRRTSGKVGVRNELWIIPTVGCINRTAERVAAEINRKCARSWSFDGAFALTHPFGCSQLGEDHVNMREILARLAEHPNAGAVLIMGLGCENNTIPGMQSSIKRTENIAYFAAQQEGDEVQLAAEIAATLVEQLAACTRSQCALSDLVVGLKCGGSDGLSGITANPLVGKLSDCVIAAGGSAVLTEVPEMFGAEQVLFAQCVNGHVYDQAWALVDEFKAYYERHGLPVYENPSPGNKAGGITTLEEKSLGCVQKGGTSAIVDVLEYAKAINKCGLNILEAPGNDLIAATALAAAGCQIVLFTTGRGTPFGTIVPTIKISTNSELADRKPHWIDYNAGVLLEGMDFDNARDELLSVVLDVAGGKQCAAENNGYKDIAIWKSGVVL